MNQNHYNVAKDILRRSLISGKLLSEYKEWDQLDYDAKSKAITDSKCNGCWKIKSLVGTISHIFGTALACKDCSDEFNYPKRSQI